MTVEAAEQVLAEIEAGLVGVTPGPWFLSGQPWFHNSSLVLAGSPDGNIAAPIADCDGILGMRDEYDGPFTLGDPEADAAHIARAADPINIRIILAGFVAIKAELSAERERADREARRAKKEKQRSIAANRRRELAEARALNATIAAERDALRAALSQAEQEIGRAEGRADKLQAGIQAYLDGNYEHPRLHRPGQCAHGVYYFDECPSCDTAHFEGVLGSLSSGEADR